LTGGGQFRVCIKRIWVATDLISESERALDFALVLAMRFRAYLTVLQVSQETYAVQYLRGSHALEAMGEEQIRSVNALELAGIKARGRCSNCDTEFRDSETCEEIMPTLVPNWPK
jgi:hypothetical protein